MTHAMILSALFCGWKTPEATAPRAAHLEGAPWGPGAVGGVRPQLLITAGVEEGCRTSSHGKVRPLPWAGVVSLCTGCAEADVGADAQRGAENGNPSVPPSPPDKTAQKQTRHSRHFPPTCSLCPTDEALFAKPVLEQNRLREGPRGARHPVLSLGGRKVNGAPWTSGRWGGAALACWGGVCVHARRTRTCTHTRGRCAELAVPSPVSTPKASPPGCAVTYPVCL